MINLGTLTVHVERISQDLKQGELIHIVILGLDPTRVQMICDSASRWVDGLGKEMEDMATDEAG